MISVDFEKIYTSSVEWKVAPVIPELAGLEYVCRVLPDESRLIIVLKNSKPVSWLRLKKGEQLYQTRLDETIFNSPWTRFRVGKFTHPGEPLTLVVNEDQTDFSIVQLTDETLEGNSSMYRLTDIQVDVQDVYHGHPTLLIQQKEDAKKMLM